jgi:3-oxoacyl-[acyl-carrier protein] reductase
MGSRSLTSSTFKTAREEYVEICRDRHRRKLGYREGHERGIEDGVRVNSVSSGAIMTGRRLSMLEKAAVSKEITLEEAKQQFLKQAGISRFGEAEEIADVLAFVVSPAARWMTGTVLRIDGGEVKSV